MQVDFLVNVSVACNLGELTLAHFVPSIIDAHLSSMNYDANKLPLGKLAKSTILNGFSALKVCREHFIPLGMC